MREYYDFFFHCNIFLIISDISHVCHWIENTCFFIHLDLLSPDLYHWLKAYYFKVFLNKQSFKSYESNKMNILTRLRDTARRE
jgi:hypothetical protein